jgi:hypothetical protein
MRNRILTVTGLALALCIASKMNAGQTPTAQTVAPKVAVGGKLQAKASSPSPAANAKQPSQKTAIEKGHVVVKTSGPSSFWAEEVDVDDDGVVESNQFLYDAKRGMLFTYREDDFGCANGGTATGRILEALYAQGIAAGKLVGSGWYVVNLDAGKCGAKQSGVYGCKFDTSGNPTEWGIATINNTTGEIDVAVAN